MGNHQNTPSQTRSRTPRRATLALLLGLLPLLLLAGCGGGLEIAGSYVDNIPDWISNHDISETQWHNYSSAFSSEYEILWYVNSGNYLVTFNSTGTYYPDLYSRFDWTWFVGDLYYCQIAYGAASAAEAEAVTTADATDPTAGGSCGSFTWTRLDPQ